MPPVSTMTAVRIVIMKSAQMASMKTTPMSVETMILTLLLLLFSVVLVEEEMVNFPYVLLPLPIVWISIPRVEQ